jgi:hypothetical protein
MPRRIVTIDDPGGKSKILMDKDLSCPLTDPARPGFKRFQIWVTESTPSTFDFPDVIDQKNQMLSPPDKGSVCHVYHIPPDDAWINHIKQSDVQKYFQSIHAEKASLFDKGKHPYYQSLNALAFCLVLKGEIDLILDKEIIHLSKGDTVIQKGSNHAWSNRSNEECILAISLHAGLIK